MKTKCFFAFVVLTLAPFAARAQNGGPFDLSWCTVDGGGGASSGGQFALSGTIGQPDAGTLSGSSFTLEGGFWSGVSVLQTLGAPLLKIRLVPGGQALLSWPVNVSGFSLEERTNVAGGDWSPTPQPVIDTETEHTVTVPANGVVKIFRLKK